MRNKSVFALIGGLIVIVLLSFKDSSSPEKYVQGYFLQLNKFNKSQLELFEHIGYSDLNSPKDIELLKQEIYNSRTFLKSLDFWFRYSEPVAYKKMNGPLPVEWETEVFEKFEKPYKREGAGLSLAAMYLEEKSIRKDSLLHLIGSAIEATKVYYADSIINELRSYHHFFLCNRLFLLNLAAIYTTGFECPDTARIIPELRSMLMSVGDIYESFNESFPGTPLSSEYLALYRNAIVFVKAGTDKYSQFDHFLFIKDYVNPLFAINQKLIHEYAVSSKSLVDYSLNKNSGSIFNKDLYNGQNAKGIFLRVSDTEALCEIDRLGKLLFYDPILSGNNSRSCVSCHKPTAYFTDTIVSSSLQFNHKDVLQRNSPSLLNVEYNHLIMLDGKHISLQDQTRAVITNPIELGCSEKEVLQKVLSCKEYKNAFRNLLKYTPQEKEVTFEHIVSAITFYYAKFSHYYSPFDFAINENRSIEFSAKAGFNLFMSKAQCGTCHFVPHFNGVKPPYVSSEFEVLGVPADTNFNALSSDKGRDNVNHASETLNAFRTGSIRNAAYTKPYMHNGVFNTLEQVIDFYDNGGGIGRGLHVGNQTLSADSLKLSKEEKNDLIAFVKSLNEDIKFEEAPVKLPLSKIKGLNTRKVGGEY